MIPPPASLIFLQKTFYMGRALGLYLSDTRAVNLPESFLQIGTARILGIPFPVVVLIIVVAAAHLVLTKTPFGRQVYAVGNDQEKAQKAGLAVNKILLGVYLICGFLLRQGGLWPLPN